MRGRRNIKYSSRMPSLFIICMLVFVALFGLCISSVSEMGKTSTESSNEIGQQSRSKLIIFSNTTWTAANSPYNITRDVQIATNATLTIQPGVIIDFKGDYEILVKGIINAQGSASKRIIFTGIGGGHGNGSVGCQLKFKDTDLSKSKLNYIKMEKADRAIQIGQETEHNQGEKNWGTLTVSNIIFNKVEIITDGYETGAKLLINNAIITSSKIEGNYPRSEEIIIKNATISNTTITADSYNKGITIENSNFADGELKIGCCGANYKIINTVIKNSKFYDYNDHYYVTINGCKIINTPLDLNMANKVSIYSSQIVYNGSYAIKTAEIIIDKSIIWGYGSKNGVGIIISDNDYGDTCITNSTITHNLVGINVSYLKKDILVENCNFFNNTNYNMMDTSKYDINAKNNYWGTNKTNEITTKIYDYYDDINYGEVLYQPYLKNPNPNAPKGIDNIAPSANAGPDKNVKVGTSVNFDGSGSFDFNKDTLSYKWDFGDGKSSSWLQSSITSHIYKTIGTYTVTLTVSDGSLKDTDTCRVYVTSSGGNTTNNSAPVADAGPDQNVKVNQTVNFDGKGTYDPDGDPLLYKWFFGDGSSTGWNNHSKASKSYPTAGKYTLTLTVSDGALTDNDTCVVQVSTTSSNNTAPVADAGPDQNAKENQAVYFNSSGSRDPDSDPLKYKWDFGDGTSTYWVNNTNVSHFYNKSGRFTVILTVSDGKLTDSDNCIVTITSSSPASPTDKDGDGVPDNEDRFPNNPNEWLDSDDDGFGDNSDKFPRDETQWNDTDGDGYGDNQDGNNPDVFPFEPTQWVDLDRDGHGDNPLGKDGDAYPNDPEKWKVTDEKTPPDETGEDKINEIIKDEIIHDAIEEGTIAGIMHINEYNRETSNCYEQGLELELITINSKKIEFVVRSDQNHGKVILLNIDSKNEFRISNVYNIIVQLDGKTIESALYTTVLSSDGANALYCIIVSNEGTQVLVYIPHFSEHKISIERLSGSGESSQSSDNNWMIIGGLIVGIIIILILITINQYLRNQRVHKSRNDSRIIKDPDEAEDYRYDYDPTILDKHEKFHSPLQKVIYKNKHNKRYKNRLDDDLIYYQNLENPKTKHSPMRPKYKGDNRYRLNYNSTIELKQSRNKLEIDLKRFKKEMIYNKELGSLNYKRGDLIFLLEEKYHQGEFPEETYNLIFDDIYKYIKE